MEEEDSPFPPFPALSSPSTPFFRLNLQTPQALNQESNPKQAYQNAFATLLLLSHNKKFHTHSSSNIRLSGQIPPSYTQNSSTSTLAKIE